MRVQLLPLCCLLGAVLAIAPAATGQVYSSGASPGYYAYPYYGNGGWNGFNPGIGSTPAGSYLGGLSSAIRAEGQYNLLSSQAAVNAEQAAQMDIENQVRWTNAYYEMRRMRDAYKQETKAPPTPPESWARLAHAATPQRLPSAALDPVTGEISWPQLLHGEEFKTDRETLDKLFAQRAAAHGAIGARAHAKIREAVDQALDRLKPHVGKVDTRSYNQARNFLTSLAYEANFPAG